jgi:serine/threonine protein kinase
MEVPTPLGNGWLGEMFQIEYEQEYVRMYNVDAISSSLREDLLFRRLFGLEVFHPNLPNLIQLDSGSLATPYRSGVSVLEIIQERGFQNDHLLLHFIEQAYLLLSFVHSKGWIHGDLHPGLIYITKDGHVVIEGFGRRPSPVEHPHTGHHRYLPPEPFGSKMGDMYSLGVIALELLIGAHVPLGDILKESHRKKIDDYLHKIRYSDPTCVAFIKGSLQFSAAQRTKVSTLFSSRLSIDPSEEWLVFCANSEGRYQSETTDPMDVIFHTEEEVSSDSFFPSLEDMSLNELTEEILPQQPLSEAVQTSFRHKNKNPLLVALAMLVVLLILAVISYYV